ncbi:MAG: hypothetical protein ACU836_07000 [Gammaproteobacteria bacterium]
MNAALVLGDIIRLLWLVLGSALLISAPSFIRVFSVKQSLIAYVILVMVPLPFVTLAWLADAVPNFMPLKFHGSLLAISFLAVTFVFPFIRFPFFQCLPIRLDTPLCLIAVIYFWKYSDLWLSWLM